MPSILSVAVGTFLGLWLSMVVLCSPIFASTSCRRLLNSGPSEYLFVNYVAGVGAFTFGHVALIYGGALVNDVVEVDTGVWFLGVTILYVAAGWGFASFGFSLFEWWEPSESGVDGRIVLGVVAIWYLIWTFLLAALFAFAWFLAFYPG